MGINLDPLYSVFKSPIKVGSWNIRALDYKVSSKVIKILKGLEIGIFVLFANKAEGDIEDYTNI